MGHIGKRIFHLRFGKRPFRPICDARGFVDAGVGDVFCQDIISNLIAIPASHRCDLSIEQGFWEYAQRMVKDLEILSRRMKNLRYRFVLEQVNDGVQRQFVRENINQSCTFIVIPRVCDLHQQEARKIGAISCEFRVESYKRLFAGGSAECVQIISSTNDFHKSIRCFGAATI